MSDPCRGLDDFWSTDGSCREKTTKEEQQITNVESKDLIEISPPQIKSITREIQAAPFCARAAEAAITF
jgi:hypothetical protein